MVPGLISALSQLVRIGVIDESGYIRNAKELRRMGVPVRICQRVREDGEAGERRILLSGEVLQKPVFLTASDIRQLQLAKGAIRGRDRNPASKGQDPG